MVIYKINSVKNKIKGAEQQNTLNKEALDKKVRKQEHIYISDNTREDIKDLLRIIKDLTVTKENFRYRDWVTKLNTRYSPYCKLDKKLEDINDKVNKSLGEFVLLMKFKWTSNDEFHVWRYQTEEEALKELKRLSFLEDLEYVKQTINWSSLSAIRIWSKPCPEYPSSFSQSIYSCSQFHLTFKELSPLMLYISEPIVDDIIFLR
ncbi:hypothetical protein GLOIN_2v1777104 [Rhizophagus irregularis DAOM 181602=DAOM 197198]|uniref:Uncharacterized protein n=1 Tax=Rhizophagus irregularis (strain DAOM 181602 / DAOM 197198 / MUCL 43194) TaxID=747089 RepID=A0A2P4PVK4_RHIID|nr:hypothetical protein GLOIN_2v1777104 [Rhizophagus irregularis DAOM 181602=DAOM 197198]POG69398.1 hypothetical protein GLOIN_2v1777104 [Rhizophagus irregularis DAOM 181602=DAOM 197198]|eukprot:XP_025176264.1 hypothetical protein GLOIN_2v1777104 [Rhizophagus irregularis DAOM 181602=DAOM 197198]